MVDELTQPGTPNTSMREALRQIEIILRDVSPKPTSGDYLAEARGGVMYGFDEKSFGQDSGVMPLE